MPGIDGWNMKKRKVLECLIQDGWKIKEISEKTRMSIYMIRGELIRGLEGEDLEMRHYVKYVPELALKNIVVELIGEDGLDSLVRFETEGKEPGKSKKAGERKK